MTKRRDWLAGLFGGAFAAFVPLLSRREVPTPPLLSDLTDERGVESAPVTKARQRLVMAQRPMGLSSGIGHDYLPEPDGPEFIVQRWCEKTLTWEPTHWDGVELPQGGLS